YYRRFSLRTQVRPFRDSTIPVVCHPHRCDSVSFYLERQDIRSYSRDERDRLIADLRSRPETIVFVTSAHALDELLTLLPESMEFMPRGKSTWMTAGVVRQRTLTCRAAQPVDPCRLAPAGSLRPRHSSTVAKRQAEILNSQFRACTFPPHN